MEVQDCGFMKDKLASLEQSEWTEKSFFHSDLAQNIDCFELHIFNLLEVKHFSERFRL